MAAVAPIVINDGLATPVAHTFIPIDFKDGVWWFEDQTGANPLGFQRLSLSLTRPQGGNQGTSSQSRVSRFKATIHLPRLETLGNAANGLTPAPVLAYKPMWSIEGVLPERATAQDRKDGRVYALNLLSNSQVVAMIDSLQSIY